MSTKLKDVLTTGEVAKICNVAPRTVSKWFDSGALRGYRIPGSKDRRIPINQLIRFMKQHGMPLSTDCKVTYTEVSPPYRLAYKTLTDFVPGVAPYEVATVVELQTSTDGVKITVTSQAMHDDLWTERARAGHESQMRKLDALMTAHGKTVRS